MGQRIEAANGRQNDLNDGTGPDDSRAQRVRRGGRIRSALAHVRVELCKLVNLERCRSPTVPQAQR